MPLQQPMEGECSRECKSNAIVLVVVCAFGCERMVGVGMRRVVGGRLTHHFWYALAFVK